MKKKSAIPARKPRMTNERVVAILMQEIADVRLELKQDISALGNRLDGRIDGLETRIDHLNAKVDRNHLQVLRIADGVDTRLTRVEAKVG